jgi:putative hydrolase of HD superfamily
MHDLVEIIAGDTFAYGDLSGQKEKEQEAAQQLFRPLPKNTRNEMFELWKEWEADQTEEVHFVRAIDRLQPAVMNLLTNGWSWKEFKVSEKMTRKNQQMITSRGRNLKRMLRMIISTAKKEKMFWDGKS